MSDIPTPETDAVATHEGNWDTKALRMTAHARKLERERDEARNGWSQCRDLGQKIDDELESERKKAAEQRLTAQSLKAECGKLRDEITRLERELADVRKDSTALLSERNVARAVIIDLQQLVTRLRREGYEARELNENYKLLTNSLVANRENNDINRITHIVFRAIRTMFQCKESAK